MSTFLAIVALCLVLIIHEGGHYLAAVASGMKVDRFSVFGIGPKVVTLGHFRGTEFVISAIPFGAYVQIRGMEPEDEPPPPESGAGEGEPGAAAGQAPLLAAAPDDSDSYRNKPLGWRILAILGGPLANYIAAFAVFFASFLAVGAPGTPDAIVIAGFQGESAAEAAGLEVGDALRSIGGTAIDPTDIGSVLTAAEPYLDTTVPVVVERGAPGDAAARVTVDVTLPSTPPALGVALEPRAPREAVGIATAAWLAVERPLEITSMQLQGLWKLITFQVRGQVNGPVGIVKHIARSAESGWLALLLTMGFISTLLGMFNLLPIPGLDGGRLVFLFGEGLAGGRPIVRRETEENIHGYGILALLLLIAVATVGDVRAR
jgi:regulator of sigma E protease